MNQITLYSKTTTERLTYIAQLVFEQLLGLELSLTSDVDTFLSSQSTQLNYSNNSDLPGFQIKPYELLFEEDIKPIRIELGQEWNNLPSLIIEGYQHFDLLAISFYLVSRFEEYVPFEKDAHNRFTASQSCLLKFVLLQRPIVNEWALGLLNQLITQNTDLQTTPRQFNYVSTIDIDQAWKYRNKGFLRSFGGLVRDSARRSWQEVKDRVSVLTNQKADPFYNFDWQDKVHQKFKTSVNYFIQIGKRGKFDKNTDVSNAEFQRCINQINDTYTIGIHPSYRSNYEHALVAQEHQMLENIVAHDIVHSRQHFLMHKMPETYVTLEDIGITEDHTMGYSTHLGFRAGIAAPFHFFNLTTNKVTNLELIPFCCMDITPLHYMNQPPRQAVATIIELMERVKNVGGLFVSLWHNESMSEDGRWQGWRTVYSQMVEHAYTLNADDEK